MAKINPIGPQNIVLEFSSTDSNKETKQNSDIMPTNIEKKFELPKKAVNAIKASVLYNKNEQYEPKEYIPLDATPQEVRDILADKNQVGRSFWGFKRAIKNGIKNSENPKQAIENLNFLLNAEKGKLNASTISSILSITETINNGKGAHANYLKKHYGFEGGKLDNESFAQITKVQAQDMMLLAATNTIINQNQQMMFDQQMLMHQQMMFDQQMLMNQQMMMSTPGMGFI